MSELTKEQEQQQSPNVKDFTLGSKQPRIYPVTEGIQSKHTRLAYQQNFDRFLNKISIHDRQVLLDFSPKVIKQIIIDYIRYLSEEKGIRRNSIKTQIAPIIHFFKINNDDFNLRMDNFKLHLPPDEGPVNEDRPYTTEEIAQVIRVCGSDPRTRVAILLLCSSGMRLGALHSLQIGDLTRIPEWNLYKVQVYARTHDKYLTFCTPECANAIQDYLEYRKRAGEDPLKDKSPLIREQFNPDNPFIINSPRFVSEDTIEYILTHALKQSGVRKPGVVHMSHGFRKFFINQCENNSSMKSLFVDVLANHDTGVKKHYLRVKESELLQEYLKAVDALTIDPNNRLKARVIQLESEQSQEIAQLKAQLHEYRETARKDEEAWKESW
jgi:integrase